MANVDDDDLDMEMPYKHVITKIKLVHNGGRYVLDLAGAQFGYHEPVTPMNEYMADRGTFVDVLGEPPARFGSEKAEYKQLLDTNGPHKISGQLWFIVNFETSKILLKVATFEVESHEISVKKFLRLADSVYERYTKNMLENLEEFIRLYLKDFGETLASTGQFKGIDNLKDAEGGIRGISCYGPVGGWGPRR